MRKPDLSGVIRQIIPKREENPNIYYSDIEEEIVEDHVARHFGRYADAFYDSTPRGVRVDVAIIEPTPLREYITLATIGMGAYRMPSSEELADFDVGRIELMMCLPPDWEIRNPDEIWYWPVRWLKRIARMPVLNGIWLGWGSIMPTGRPVSEICDFRAMLLALPGDFAPAAAYCTLPNGERVCFYQLVPLYENEMKYGRQNGPERLIARLDDEMISMVRTGRRNAIFFEI